ncbi:hypothetical protein JT06_12995 [Desulfobulbus sp. Tol-SR]|nr:hypothetical protein JT06_12995 [Desulfobulbus sp. Tol-SR]
MSSYPVISTFRPCHFDFSAPVISTFRPLSFRPFPFVISTEGRDLRQEKQDFSLSLEMTRKKSK